MLLKDQTSSHLADLFRALSDPTRLRIISVLLDGEMNVTRLKNGIVDKIRRPPMDYFKMFYADTAIYGNTAGLMCSYDVFGAGHLLFGTDMPYDSQFVLAFTGETIKSIEQMAISDTEKKMIFEENARRLLHLAV